MNLIDKTIALFDPVSGAKRAAARDALSQMNKIYKQRDSKKRNFDGAAKGPRYTGWRRPDGSANANLEGSLEWVVRSSRDLARNNPYHVGAVRAAVNNTVGAGINPHLRYSFDELSQREAALKKSKIVTSHYNKWGGTTDCDFDGRLTLNGITHLAFQTERESGECLIRRIRRKSKEGFIPFQVQILEGDYLDSTKDKTLADGGRIVKGIEFDSKGRRRGYWLYEDHPGDTGVFRHGVISKFVPAADIIHMYEIHRPGQARGYPCCAPIITRLKDFDDFEDASLVRQKIAACWSVFVKDMEGPSKMAAPTVMDANGEPQTQVEPLERVNPGMIEYLPPGKDISFASPPGVENYKEYSTSVLHAIATGFGVTYEAMTGDYSGVNYSSGRMGWLEMNRNVISWRAFIIQAQMLDNIQKWFEEALDLRGLETETLEWTWNPPKREMTDPSKEIGGKIKEIRAGGKPLRRYIAEQGDDFEQVLSEYMEDNVLLDKYGLIFDSDARKTGVSGQLQAEQNNVNDDSNDDDKEDVKKNPPGDD